MVDVLVRAADAGDTYLAWRWLDDLDNPRAQRLDAGRLDAAIAALNESLIAPLPGETEEQAHDRAMRDGGFIALDREMALSGKLADAVLPARLIAEITDRTKRSHVRVRLTPSPRLARIPWEALTLDAKAHRRLIDAADVVYDPPATVRSERSVQPDAWQDRAGRPAVFVIDPNTKTTQLKPIVKGDKAATKMFRDRIMSYAAKRLAEPDNVDVAISDDVSRFQLQDWLATPLSRLFYYGHVSSLPDEPGSAALHLSDERSDTWGMAAPVGSHLPLSALDLLLGTMTAPLEQRGKYGSDDTLPGHQIWPMPPRVAVIACEGGADFRSTETFGLVIAMLNAGAELVTTTRWTMPTDSTFWKYHRQVEAQGARPTTEFALTVDDAHCHADPLGELARWQRKQLAQWREHGDIAHTPLIWASVINTWAPAVH